MYSTPPPPPLPIQMDFSSHLFDLTVWLDMCYSTFNRTYNDKADSTGVKSKRRRLWVGTLSQPNLDFWPIWSVGRLGNNPTVVTQFR